MGMQGTLINVAAVIVGSVIGLVLHSRVPKKITAIAFQGIGLFTLFLGVTMAMKTSNFLVMIFSIVVGSIIGELVGIEELIDRFSVWLKGRLKHGDEKFSEGFVVSSLLFCMGSMAILGAIEEGLGGTPDLLLAKSLLDGFSSIVLSSSLGLGVLFSTIPLLIYQGSLTLFAGSLQPYLTEMIIDELSSVGGLLLVGLGISILEIKKLKIINMLPSLIVVVIFLGIL